MPSLKRGATLKTLEGESLQVVDILGEGGQGIIYRVRFRKEYYALKWYKKIESQRFYDNLKENVARGSPAPTFLWPLAVTEKDEKGGFGYVMQVKPDCYKDFSLFILNRVKFSSFAAVINAALQITASFKTLHNKGLSYQDLNDGNFFIDPATGEVLICDNDNVAPYGESLGIAGKARYMAPEVVRNITRPNVMTDRFSLTVVLFRLLFLDHPLEGRRVVEAPCLTEELELKFYGKNPVFVYDPLDNSNRPVRGVHANVVRFWPMYPKFIRDKFVEALSQEAMHGQKPRPTDNDWQQCFTRLRDCIVTCSCGEETFLAPGEDSFCINCGRKIPKPPALNCHNGKYEPPLFPGVKLYRCHVDKLSDDYCEVIGEVVRNPKNPGVWGLRNLSDMVWNAETQDGEIRPVGRGQIAPVMQIKALHFPNGTGNVEK